MAPAGDVAMPSPPAASASPSASPSASASPTGSPASLQPCATRDFKKGEVVLAFHGQLLYEAEVLSVNGNPVKSYEVHYNGFKMSWNETVDRACVVDHNESNLRIAHRLLSSAQARQRRAAVPTNSFEVEVEEEEEEEDGGEEDGVRKKARSEADLPAMFNMPSELKRASVDDWESITKLSTLITLPREPSVEKILKLWEESRVAAGKEVDRATTEVCASLTEYFDALAPTMLLYRAERQQFENHFGKNSPDSPRPSSVYGVEHLIRLFIKLPQLLLDSGIYEEDKALLKKIAERVNDLMFYIKCNGRTLFANGGYEDASVANGDSKGRR